MTESNAPSLSRRARARIVATVGPACCSPESLLSLIRAGVDVFRLNMAHGTLEEHTLTFQTIRGLSRQTRPIAVLADLAGPKIRLKGIPHGKLLCEEDAFYTFLRAADPSVPGGLTSNYDRLVDELRVGDHVMLADGTVAMVVTEKKKDQVVCRCIQRGLIRSRQGINLPGAKISIPAMTEHDFRCAQWAAEMQVDFVSLSFVRKAEEILRLKEYLRQHACDAWVVAKIEKPEALQAIESIVKASDAVMVARGDLGVEIDVAKVPVAQKHIITTCNRLRRPVIVATQMLDSMQHATRPTRAEVTDVANAILDGADACMLSGETAIGEHPELVVRTMNRVMLEAEELLLKRGPVAEAWSAQDGLQDVTQSVVYGAAKIADRLSAAMVVIATQSGQTAVVKSNQRIYIPTVTVSSSEAVLRRTCLFWGLTPLPDAPVDEPDALVDFILDWGKAEGTLTRGDRVVLVAGTGIQNTAHYVVTVLTVV